ncbi:MAG: hypothetical protein E7576_00805 [Ruminococcaceae bacterium]|jgi:hypothetical protein|nr:hypothetical protein [Oscillospiraceae bacterium]
MRKTVLVSDESGNEYEPTFEKRARGLVKKGRARWIGDNRICLASPPDHDFRKDTEMSENRIEPALTVEYVLGQIEKISAEPAYIGEAIAKIDNSAPEKSGSIAAVVEARESTNRAVLDFYRQIYSDLNAEAHAMTVLEKAVSTAGIPMGEVTNMLNRLLGFESAK